MSDCSKKTAVCLSLIALGSLGGGTVRAMGGGTCVTTNLTISVIRTPLSFGSLTPCTVSSGQVLIDPQNKRSTAGCIVGTGGTFQSVEISVGGTSGKAIVSVTSPTYQITAGGNSMAVGTYDFQKKGGGRSVTLNLPATTNIGAVLQVSAGQAGGVYTGNFNVRAICQ